MIPTTHFRPNTFQTHYPELYIELSTNYPNYPLAEAYYMRENGLAERPRCYCGNELKFISLSKGYSKYCSSRCANSDPDKINKTKQNLLKKYGVENISMLQSVKDKKAGKCNKGGGKEWSEETRKKMKQTMLERYGVEHYSMTEEYKKKVRNTCMERYGVEHHSQLDIEKEKKKTTSLMHYNTQHPMQSEQIKQKMIETCLSKYGVENVFESDEVRDKIKQTCLEKYGTENPLGSKEIRDKRAQTVIERYGDENYNNRAQTEQTCLSKYGGPAPMSSDEIKKKQQSTVDRLYGVDNVKRIGIYDRHTDLIEYDGLEWKMNCPHPQCTFCTEKYYMTSQQIHNDRLRNNIETCTRLLPIHKKQRSYLEIQICLWLQEAGIEYEEKEDRQILNGRGIDIYIPSKHIGIEANGYRWHSDRFKPVHFHEEKFQECHTQGIQLIQIWEDWILNKPEIVKSMLLSKLGIAKRIGASKCKVQHIKPKQAQQFLIQNHIQGRCNASVHLGLMYKGELVALMCFSKRSKLSGSKTVMDGDWELIRFCNKCGYSVYAGAKRLLTHFIKEYHPKQITSFSANDISDGHLYKTLGFETDGKISSSYWYIEPNTHRRYHRSVFTRDGILRHGLISNTVDPKSWTERSVMDAAGYYRIYDSGTTKWVLKI